MAAAESVPPAPRRAADADGDGMIALIGGVFAEYPGCVLDVDGEMPDLRAPASAFAARDGVLWVAEEGGRIVACVGCVPAAEPDTMELLRLYVAGSARRRGLGARLVALVEAEAARRGFGAVTLWTDTRFRDAHRLYERLGYRRRGGTRALGDLSNSVEYNYVRVLRGPDGVRA